MAAAVALTACTTVQNDVSETKPAPTPEMSAASHRQWEESTRDFADDLMAEAQRAHNAGFIAEAAALADDALCLVLETPVGYSPDDRYLGYLAELIDEATILSSSIRRSNGSWKAWHRPANTALESKPVCHAPALTCP